MDLTDMKHEAYDSDEVEESEVGMYCPGCGSQLLQRSDACPNCGVTIPPALWGEISAGATVAPSVDTEPSLVGLVLENRYRVEGLIARGGMGEVYRGRDIRLDRRVAIKFLAEQFRSDSSVVQRFTREAQSAAKLDHPNIVAVYSVGEENGAPFFVMKYVEGKTLHDLIRAEGRLPLARAVEIATQVCDGLEHIHASGFVHRDIKPQNIKVEPSGRCLILDFGILRIMESNYTQTGLVAGTPEYMAPEQAKDPKLVDARADLYALGVTLFHLVTGRPPFTASSAFELLLKHHSEAPPKACEVVSELPDAVDVLLQKVLEKEPARRFQTAAEMRTALLTLASSPASRPTPLAAVAHADTAAFEMPRNEPPPIIEEVRKPATDLSASRISGESIVSSSVFLRPRRRGIAIAAVAAVVVAGGIATWVLTRDGEPALPRVPVEPVVSAPIPSAPSPSPQPAAAPAAPVVPRQTAIAAARPEPRAKPASRPTVAKREPAKARPSPKPRWQPQPARVDDEPRAHPVSVAALQPPPKTSPPRLAVKTRPKGATVMANGRTLGKTPLRGAKLEPGRYEVVVELSGHRTHREPVTLGEGELKRLSVDLDPLPGRIHVVTLHEGRGTWARILIDGEFVGESHSFQKEIRAGRHQVTAQRAGYRTVAKTVTVPLGKKKVVTLLLEKE